MAEKRKGEKETAARTGGAIWHSVIQCPPMVEGRKASEELADRYPNWSLVAVDERQRAWPVLLHLATYQRTHTVYIHYPSTVLGAPLNADEVNYSVAFAFSGSKNR